MSYEQVMRMVTERMDRIEDKIDGIVPELASLSAHYEEHAKAAEARILSKSKAWAAAIAGLLGLATSVIVAVLR